jgi:hypothetical protein
MYTLTALYEHSCYPEKATQVIAAAGRTPDRSRTTPFTKKHPRLETTAEWDFSRLEEALMAERRLKLEPGVKVTLPGSA